MITITSFIHRDEFSNLIRRWMYNQHTDSDAGGLLRLVHFNNVFVSRYLMRFSHAVFRHLFGKSLKFEKVLSKGDLKDAIVVNPPFQTPRIDQLIREYLTNPADYYRETPFHGHLFFQSTPPEGNRFIGGYRVKRIRRLAEKSGRYIIEAIYEKIKQQAELMADERARHLGIVREMLLTSPEEMIDEFSKAEKRILDQIRTNQPVMFRNGLQIKDVAGIKVILEKNELARLHAALVDLGCVVIEEEHHSGRYNATNLVVEYRPDKAAILADPLPGTIGKVFQTRGYSARQADRLFAEFVQSGEETVRLEIIVSNYEELLESELGRCMHEERIIRQRREQQYRGHMAQNIEFLMEYLFCLPASDQFPSDRLPILIWHRYLPDYFDEIKRGLFHVPSVELNAL